MAGLKILSCKMGKHEWKNITASDSPYELWECVNCKAKKYNMGASGSPGAEAPATTAAPAAPAAPPAPAAETDELTGLMNKGGALEAIKTFLKKNKNANYTICMCDIDGFKKINEVYETKCGDIVLREVAQILSNEISGMGTPYRWGGDEFLLLFPSKNGDEVYNKLFTVREKIKTRVIFYDGDGVSVTMTFGLTEYDFSGNIDGFVAEAEEKLNLGKQMGGDQVIF